MTYLLYAQLDPSEVKPGWLGLAVIVALLIATLLLWRSMNRQMKKVDFDQPDTPDEDGSPPSDERGGRESDQG